LLKSNSQGKTKDYDIPHRTKITELVLACAAEIEADLTQELKVNELLPDILLANLFCQECPGCVSLTFDGWTSKIMTSYLAITSHWLSSEWEL